MEGSSISEVMGKKTVKRQEENVLDLSGKGMRSMNSLPKRHSISDLVLDNNSITKIEKLDAFPKLCSLSMVGNQLVRMNGVNFAKNLMSVNLSNNGIVSMEGLCWLVHLEYLDLSKNNIKRIQNVSYCTKLKHMDLSENSVTDISNLKSLVQLKVLLLHGNAITTIERAEENLPEQIETLSLSTNGISDLNEVRHLSRLLNLKHFFIEDNPCVMATISLQGFNCRLFILSCLSSLVTLNGGAVTDDERQDAERLSRDENLSLFTFGHHLELVLYLARTCPVKDTIQVSKDQNNFLDDFLQKRRVEIFSDQKGTEVKKNDFPLNNAVNEVVDVKASDILQSSSYSFLGLTESTQNGSGNFSPEEESETDTLRSESRFLPVYSPIKKTPEIDRGRFQSSPSWEVPPLDNGKPLSSMTDDLNNVSEKFPIMTEEEANKLIDLAATILQSRIRGFLVRRKFDYRSFKKIHNAASKIQALWRGYYFRNHSKQGLDVRNEIRVQRLQKYISILCFMMQKSAKQHEIEKQQMLEIITLLYEKFTQLSEKVEKLESSTIESNKTEIHGNSLEGNLHPVFRPHPLLSRTIEQRESIRDSNHAPNYVQDFPLPENVRNEVKDSNNVISLSEDVGMKFDKISDDVTEFHSEKVKDFGTQERHMVEKREDYLWSKNVQQTEESMMEDDNMMDEEDDLRWDKESGKSENSSDVESDNESYSENLSKRYDDQDGTNVDSYETSRVPDVNLSCAGNGTISSEISEAFMTANVCELLETIESDKKETFPNIQTPHGDFETSESYIGLDVIKDSSSVGIRGSVGSDDDNLGEQFGNEKPSCSNFESDREEAATGENDKNILTNFEDNSIKEKEGVYHVEELDVFGESDKTKNNQTEDKILDVCNRDMAVEQISNQPNAENSVDNDTGPFKVPEFIVVGDKNDKRVTEDVLNPSGMENRFADKFAEYGENSGDSHGQGKENPQKVYGRVSINSSEKRTTTSDNITSVRKEENYSKKEEDITNEVQFSEVNIKDDRSGDKTMKSPGDHIGENLKLDDELVSRIDVTGDSEFCGEESIKVEETEIFSSKQEVVEKYAMTSHGCTEKRSDDSVDYIKDETMEESLYHNELCPQKGEITVGLDELISGDKIVSSNVEYEDFRGANVENNVAIMGNNMANMESNVQSSDGINNGTEYSQLDTLKMDDTLVKANVHSDRLERETPIENASDAKKISPTLGERASSLLSALKNEITGVSSKDIQSKESLTLRLSATHGGDVDVTNTQPDPTSDHSTSEIQ